jgi:hypothetical protein
MKKSAEMQNVRYIPYIPAKQPSDGRVIVHNHVQHDERTEPEEHGFRAWLQTPNPDKLEPCSCGWSGQAHFRVKG